MMTDTTSPIDTAPAYATTWTLTITDEGGKWGEEDLTPYLAPQADYAAMKKGQPLADLLDRAELETHLRNRVADGDYGQGEEGFAGATVEVSWSIRDGDEALIDEGSLQVDLAPEEPECDDSRGHRWVSTVEVDGGISENPGVWSLGGTAMAYREHCTRCGLVRTTQTAGCQRNPGEAATSVQYEQPE